MAAERPAFLETDRLPRPYEFWYRRKGKTDVKDEPLWVVAHSLREATMRAEAQIGAEHEIVSARQVAGGIMLMPTGELVFA